MSNIYHTEPATHGKVVLKTTYGDIDIELWPKEAPLACRNFIQLCMEGYYDKSPIHRIIKQFMIQMGDPTGTGKGGESIWKRPFKDEFHGRIKFNHRGQVAMANENKPDSNHSQFFITLGPCEWLNKKHTIFGKVTGNTIFNLLRMGDAEVDDKEAPTEPLFILKVEILNNPFDDIVPRDLSKITKTGDASTPIAAPVVKKAVQNKKLLSFAEDDDNDENDDMLKKKLKSDSKLEKSQEISTQSESSKEEPLENLSISNNSDINNDSKKPAKIVDLNAFETTMREKMLNRRKLFDKNDDNDDNNEIKIFGNKTSNQLNDQDTPKESIDISSISNTNQLDEKQNLLMEKKFEFDKLRNDLLNSKKAIRVITGAESEQVKSDIAKTDVYNPLEQRRQRYLKRKKEFGNRQDETLSKLEAFTNSIREKKQKTNIVEEKQPIAETYHGQILEKSEIEDLEDSSELNNSWHLGKLKFKKHIDDEYRKGGDGRNIDDYAIIDTRITKS